MSKCALIKRSDNVDHRESEADFAEVGLDYTEYVRKDVAVSRRDRIGVLIGNAGMPIVNGSACRSGAS